MSVRRRTIEYAAAAIVVSAAIIAASVLYMGLPVSSTQPSSSAQAGQVSSLAIRLTDPPQVPHLTTSLNLTYSSLGLLVGEPTGSQGQLTTKSVAVTPSGGSSTIDLLTLQNVSQTIALASLPNDSIVYSVAFTVTGIKIDVNNTISAVSLATGGSFTVTVAQPSAQHGDDYLLLQLNPVVVNTPSGYQLIPSAVGIMGHEEAGLDLVGYRHQITSGETNNLQSAHGNVSASLVSLTVSGNTTSVTIKVNNSASVPVELNAIGLHGNFTVVGSVCAVLGRSFPYTQGFQGVNGMSAAHSKDSDHCVIPLHMDEVVFVPISPTSTTTSTSTSAKTATCSSGQLGLVNAMFASFNFRGLTLNAGECVLLTFTGNLNFAGDFVLVPSTSSGQVYVVSVIGSNAANQQVMCTLPLGPASCKLISPQPDSEDW